jgi:GntR family transcriptional repressor for pyruvate dehydrogenase complex
LDSIGCFATDAATGQTGDSPGELTLVKASNPVALDSPHVKSDADSRAIYESLKRQIVEGSATAGSRLPTERALANHFGAARNAVRKTLEQLCSEGLAIREAGRGTFVAYNAEARIGDFDNEAEYELSELLEARLLFEPGLAELVAERASDEDLARLTTFLGTLRAARTWSEFKEAKYRLHLAIAKASKNKFMIDMFERIITSRRASGWGGSRKFLIAGLADEGVVADHTEIVAALQKRDGPRARDLIRSHLFQTLLVANAS